MLDAVATWLAWGLTVVSGAAVVGLILADPGVHALLG